MERTIPLRALLSVTVTTAAAAVLTSAGALAATTPEPALARAPATAGLVVAAAAPAATGTATRADAANAAKPTTCLRIRGAAACVGADESDRPGISVEDTAPDRYHAVVEYYLNGYLGTKYVIHNLGHEGEIRSNREIGATVTFRAAVYKGNHRIKVSRWKTVRTDTEYPVKRDTDVTPSTARARSQICASTKSAASTCFADRKQTVVYACDTSADRRQARAEYFLGGDPTARFEIHQLAGVNTCGKAEHGDVRVSKYRASVFDLGHRVATRLYKYH
ncbi:hypothetical protein ABZU32_24315 [Sphaerisporangium sp. NPDC005288]|uniref:hypothetical protein n=1 Tax=Sphaerisporangium sp. NPDC005288 TaxID=3155114 RepID=UPI0033BAB8C5